jgi:hypothetical protein
MGMDSQPADWLPDSFYLSPMWRMLRASYRARHQLPPDPRIDDEWVETALRLTASPHNPDDPSLTPTVRAAFDLWREDQVPRWFLEAQLLTSRLLREVAVACSLAEPVVDAYHRLFFDVRTRLHASDWVLTLAVRSTPMNDFAGAQPAGLWKYMAFTGGPLVLDAVVAVTSDRKLPGWLHETFAANPVLEEQRFRLKTKLALAALTAKSAHQLGSLLELSEQLRDLEAAAGLEIEEEEALFPVAGEFLAAMSRLTPAEPKATASSTAPGKPTPARPRPANSVRATTDNGGKRRG